MMKKSMIDLRKALASKEATDVLKKTASADRAESQQYLRAFAQSFAPVLKQAVFDEETLGNIYSRVPVEAGATPRFPLDFIAPGTEDDFVSFTMPKQGRVPEKHVEGDELYIQTYKIANAIDWDLDYARDARWDVISRALDVYKSGFTKRLNDDGWHVVLATANSGGFMINDAAAAAGNFTPGLIYRMKTVQKRRTRNGDLTDLYISSEAWEDIRNWSTTEVSDNVREKLFFAPDFKSIGSIGGVNLHELRELGAGVGGTNEEYQEYLKSTLLNVDVAGNSDTELVVGLDLSKRDSFIMVERGDMETFETGEQLHRQGRAGYYGWMRVGFAGVDNRRALLGSF
jgi:hypothetical protein